MGPLPVDAVRAWCFAQKRGLGPDSIAVESGMSRGSFTFLAGGMGGEGRAFGGNGKREVVEMDRYRN